MKELKNILPIIRLLYKYKGVLSKFRYSDSGYTPNRTGWILIWLENTPKLYLQADIVYPTYDKDYDKYWSFYIADDDGHCYYFDKRKNKLVKYHYDQRLFKDAEFDEKGNFKCNYDLIDITTGESLQKKDLEVL